MRAGRMDRLITIQENTPSYNALNEDTEGWGTITTDGQVWAAKKEIAGSEVTIAGQTLQAEMVTEWRIHHRTDITNLMRISFGGNLYDITSIAEIGRGEGLLITTKLQTD